MKEQKRTILAIGAEGRLAGLVVPALAQRGAQVRAFIRHESNREMVRRNGAAEVAVGDLRHRPSLEAAIAGVDAVFHVGPAFIADEAEVGLRVIDVARQSGVRKMVFSGVNHPSNLMLPNHVVKQAVESALFASGMIYTILQPATLMQNIVPAWPSVVADGVFGEPYAVDARLARVDYRDVAEVAAIALTEDRLDYGTFELSAPGAPDRRDVAQWMSEELGRTIAPTEYAFDQWVAQSQPPFDAEQLKLLEKVFLYFSAHGSAANALVLQAILGREPRTFRQFIADLAAGRATMTPTVA